MLFFKAQPLNGKVMGPVTVFHYSVKRLDVRVLLTYTDALLMLWF